MVRKMILPKLWLQAIPKYWAENTIIPTDYPKDTNVEFSTSYDSEEILQAVKDMENNLNTEESILVDVVPENRIVGSYLGVYNVTGENGELTLLSPEKVPSTAVDIIAMHYNEESSEWEEIEDAQIINGYAYGTLESFSPIAVFALKRDTYVDTSHYLTSNDVFVANGVPIKILKNEDGESVIIDANGKETPCTDGMYIVAGTIDGTDVDSTSVYANGVDDINRIYAGSISVENGVIAKVENASVVIENCKFASVTGNGYNNRLNNLSLTVKDSKFTSVIGLANTNPIGPAKKDSNVDCELGLGANAYVVNAKMNLENISGPLVYTGGNTGLSYVHEVEATIKNCMDSDFVVAGGSNGYTKKVKINISDSSLKTMRSVNRGKVGSVDITMRNCDVETLFVCGGNDDINAGEISDVKYDITGGNIKLHSGTNNAEPLDSVSIRDIVEYVKISRTTKVEYLDNTYSILGDLIRIK